MLRRFVRKIACSSSTFPTGTITSEIGPPIASFWLFASVAAFSSRCVSIAAYAVPRSCLQSFCARWYKSCAGVNTRSAYLDDVGGAPRPGVAHASHASSADVQVAKGEIERLALRLGVHIHPVKQDFSGSTALDLLGVLVDTESGLYLLSPEKLNKVRASAMAVMRESRRRRRFVSLSHLRSFAGLAQSTHLAVTDARLHLRAIWDAVADADGRRSGFARLSHQACRDILWWIRLRDNAQVGRAIWAPPPGQSRVLHSDANNSGWGAVCDGSVPARGLFSARELALHINEKELLAVIFGVLAFMDRLRPGQHITQWVDSSVAAAQVYNWTATSPVALELLRILRRLLEDLGLSLSTQRLPSVLNLLSDRLSRARPADDWRLTREVVRSLQPVLAEGATHHFAVRLTAVARRYTSRLHDPFAYGLAFHSHWRAGDLLTPPPHALPLVLARLRDMPAPGVLLVTPDWPAQPWFGLASRLAERSWPLPFPAWARGEQQQSPWNGRVFLMGRARRHGAVTAAALPSTASAPVPVPAPLPNSWGPPWPPLPLGAMAATGSGSCISVAPNASPICLRPPRPWHVTSAISSRARASLAVAFGST